MSGESQSTAQLAADGERFLPDRMSGDIELEHRHRYLLAADLTIDKGVRDIACGGATCA